MYYVIGNPYSSALNNRFNPGKDLAQARMARDHPEYLRESGAMPSAKSLAWFGVPLKTGLQNAMLSNTPKAVSAQRWLAAGLRSVANV